MKQFDDPNILPYKPNSLNSISTESMMSEELAATAIAIVIISKTKTLSNPTGIYASPILQ